MYIIIVIVLIIAASAISLLVCRDKMTFFLNENYNNFDDTFNSTSNVSEKYKIYLKICHEKNIKPKKIFYLYKVVSNFLYVIISFFQLLQ